jgi:aminomethyltransferase
MNLLKKTPLHSKHLESKARLVDFGGWEMPVQYTGIIEEYQACRSSVAIFDTCHMGEFHFQGNIAESGLSDQLSFEISTLPIGKCRYGFLLNEKGTVIDDLIAYRIGNEEVMIVVNAGTQDNDFKIIQSRLNSPSALTNISDKTIKIDIQGPKAFHVLQGILGEQILTIPYFSFKQISFNNAPLLISRTGYTGELGYEIYLDAENGLKIWDLLIKHPDVKPAGLGARDLLRLELGYSLYGSDITLETTPMEADLGIFVDFNKNFPGKAILQKQKELGTSKLKIAFATKSRRSPRAHYKIFSGQMEIGEVTSGAFSPALSAGIGMGYVQSEFAKIGTKLQIVHDAIIIDAEIVKLPFYEKGTARIKL